MKNKRKKDKRFHLQRVVGVPEALSGIDCAMAQASLPISAESTPVTVDVQPPADTTQTVAADDSARCVSENFLTPPGQTKVFADPIGQRLAAARDERGWSRAEAASKLRLPLHIVQKIEADDFASLGGGIYLRGYLNNYARLVGVPTQAVEDVMQTHEAPPPQLVASGRISHSRYLFDRYSGAALYVVLTGVIFVPLVMFAMNMGGDVSARLLPLDSPGSTSQQANAKIDLPMNTDTATSGPTTVSSTVSAASSTSAAASSANAQSEVPLLASFASIANSPRAQMADAGAQGAGQSVRLTLAEASWVEIVDADGKRLEYGILAAGSVHNYASEKALDVRIGNTNGARLEVNGEGQDIAPFNHGNVAHFKLFAAGKTISRTDS